MYADAPSDSAPPEAVLPMDEAAMRAVDRATAALRRGEAVAIETADGSVGAAVSVESVAIDAVQRLVQLTGAAPVLAVTRRRATVLKLMGEGTGVVALSLPRCLTADEAHALADPEHRPDGAMPEGLTATAMDPGSRETAAVDLARLARLLPAAIVAPATGHTTAGHSGSAAEWAAKHDLLLVRARDIADYRVHVVRTLRRVAEARVPLSGAENTSIAAFRPIDGGPEHLAIIVGNPVAGEPVLARLHSECFTGDLLGSLRCDCGQQLRGAIAEIARQGSGVLLYLAQEGRGIGLVNKLRAYRIQDRGFDTVDANEILGFEADERVYLPAAEMLRQLGFTAVRLMTNNPEKLRQLARCGIEVVERVPHIFPSNGHNEGYLRTKAERSGHMF
ncbi:GTP cyclohydrolase [Azospirillum argentinense]|uniref:GTP cyclohydrolase-2 n=2 Tax=Azospirillum argentinense TaxID=2970906 RepID=A0A060DJV2_9PROT|nr:GTP cyclohydrolase II [Azospirillum argentinense]AIB13070.1 GTP cyclohydrolase [Azospirillum argentinense]EZQ07306.1 GTP cyclohydrolase [Azospirillum argentinense]KAA1055538.1 putative domain, not in CDD / GTP cyclohydrolase II [Azospirillum argentinense]